MAYCIKHNPPIEAYQSRCRMCEADKLSAELGAEVAKLRKLLLDIRGEDVMCDICGGSLDNGCYLMGSSIVAPKCCSVECAEKAIKEGRA